MQRGNDDEMLKMPFFWTNVSEKRRGWMWRAEMMLMTGPGEMFYLDREEGVRKEPREKDRFLHNHQWQLDRIKKKGGGWRVCVGGWVVNIT